MDIKYVSRREVFERLGMKRCVGLMRDLFTALSEKKARNILRSVVPVSEAGIMGIMPAVLPYENVVGAKLITVFHDNYRLGLPGHQGIVALFSARDGTPVGICDGMAITAVRTAAVSAVATDLLALPGASRLCIMGGGVQAGMHLEAMSLVRNIKSVRVACPDIEESERFISSHRRKYPGVEFTRYDDFRRAADGADIICTVTASRTPVLYGDRVKKGAHINAVGACAASDRELDSRAVKNSLFFCDSRVSCAAESGDFLIPLAEGEIGREHIKGELGDLLCGRVAGRGGPEDITVFESLGLACEDLACARRLLRE